MGTELSGDDLNITTHPWEGRWGGGHKLREQNRKREIIIYSIYATYCIVVRPKSQSKAHVSKKTKQKQNIASEIIQKRTKRNNRNCLYYTHSHT